MACFGVCFLVLFLVLGLDVWVFGVVWFLGLCTFGCSGFLGVGGSPPCFELL